MNEFKNILELSNYNLQTRKNSKLSGLGEIQNKLIDLSLKLDLTADQLERIGSFIVTEPKVLEDDAVSYESVTQTKPYLKELNRKIESLEEEVIIRKTK